MSNHRRWQHKKIAFSQDALRRKAEHYKNQKVTHTCTCNKCGKVFSLTLRKCDWRKRDLQTICCSSKCSHSRVWGIKHKEHLAQVMLNKSKMEVKFCPICGKLVKKHFRTFCSIACSVKFRGLNKYQGSLQYYRNMCKFTFDIFKYPQEFDFTLVDKFGWYSPANKNNNLGGVSKDHLVSVKFGWEHSIDPDVIRHPANCQIIRQSDNASKNARCSITLEQLKQRIEAWDIKYGAVVQRENF